MVSLAVIPSPVPQGAWMQLGSLGFPHLTGPRARALGRRSPSPGRHLAEHGFRPQALATSGARMI